MLPSLLPMLTRYREAVGRAGAARAAGMARDGSQATAVPAAAGTVVLVAGALQFTAWKARRLACCRQLPAHGQMLAADIGTAWRHGLRLGRQCSYCCAGLTAILLVIGVMDLCAMAGVTAAITLERLSPAGGRVARVIGIAVIGAGLLLIMRATGAG